MDNEKELIKQLRAGDESAFDRMVKTYQKEIYMLALRLTGSRDDAMDISQSVFIRAFKSVKNFRGDSSLSTWLYRIGYNQSLKHLKNARWKRFLSIDDNSIKQPSLPAADDQVRRSDFRRDLREAVEKLPPQQKAAFTLHHLQGLKLTEVAEVMERSLGTVKALHYHAVKKLREALKEWKGVEFSA